MQANILGIRKEYLPDNAGLRTILYFCGCALRCQWCMHPMPETPEPVLVWNSSKCLFCHLCERDCPTGSLHFENGELLFNPRTCSRCLRCQQHCPARTIDFSGSVVTLDEVKKRLSHDLGCYRAGGGIMLVGVNNHGDVSFSREVLRFCRENDIRTVVNTHGFLSDFEFARLTQNADEVLMDIKHYNPRMHVRLTGVSNRQILANLDYLIASGREVSAKISVIPHINDADCDAHGFGRMLAEHGVRNVYLANFDDLDHYKYGCAHLVPSRDNIRNAAMTAAQSRMASLRRYGAPDTNISPEKLARFGEILRRHGLRVRNLILPFDSQDEREEMQI
jgi:glycyl-radical enzyme activating protein